jgi:hypothetical protein
MRKSHLGVSIHMEAKPDSYLRPGDTLTIEVEVDPAFDKDEYIIRWQTVSKLPEKIPNGSKVIIHITPKQVAERFSVICTVVTNKEWHRMNEGMDDRLFLNYKVLPPR